MAAWRDQLRTALEENAGEFLQIGVLASESEHGPLAPHHASDVEQFTKAWLGVLREALDESGDECGALYYEVALAELVRGGYPKEALLRAASYAGILTAASLLAHLPDSARAEAARWFATFFAAHIARLVQTTELFPAHSRLRSSMDGALTGRGTETCEQ
jgi:hypothetical protein